jgi:alpha-glucosidase
MRTAMGNWTESIYSDGTLGFVSNQTPAIGEKVRISVRLYEDAPIKGIFLRRMRNGAEEYLEMEKDRSLGKLSYYTAETTMNEPRLIYYFVIACEHEIYFYTQAGVVNHVPGEEHDFVLMSDYVQPDWVKGAVYYQIFPTSFKDGSLSGIKEKIPYLKELGVTALYLNPIFQAPSPHKYDCADYFHVDEGLGGDEALKELSEALHENGMKLILDISINHTGLTNSWVQDKNHFYLKEKDGKLKGWAGYRMLPVLDYRNEELRNLIYRDENSVLKKWLNPPYNADGWRFDVADVFGRNDELQQADELWQEVCESIRTTKNDAMIIGEHWGDCTEYLQGQRWNAPMNYFGFGRILREFAGLKDLFLERNEVLRAIDYKLTAKDVVDRTLEFYSRIPQVVADCSMNLFDSHDVARVHNYENISFDKWKGIVISQLLWTGIPCIYYGDELGIDGYIKDDRGFRYNMPWEEENSRKKSEYFKLYQKICSLRKTETAFAEGGRKVLLADGRILAAARFFDNNIYLGIISMEDEDRTVAIPIELVGASGPEKDVDEFGEGFDGKVDDAGNFEIEIPANRALLIKLK